MYGQCELLVQIVSICIWSGMSNLEYGYMVHPIKLMFRQKLRMTIEEVVPTWKLHMRRWFVKGRICGTTLSTISEEAKRYCSSHSKVEGQIYVWS